LTTWFVRRVGVARASTFLCAAGLAAAAVTGARPIVAAVGLTFALCGGLVGMATNATAGGPRLPARTLVVVCVLLVGLFAGYLGGSARVMDETRRRLRFLGLRWSEPATLWDVDRPEDIERLAETQLASSCHLR
jgi:hypothetical protein